jgi:hypothetical protein
VPNTHPLTAEHRRHDRLLVARYAAGDGEPGLDHEAQDLIRRCSECAALAADISAISAAVSKMPVPTRPRDFRLTPEQASKLRGSRLDRWLRGITGSGWATVRPVAAVALSIGLVMSVVGALPILSAAAPPPADTINAPVAAGQQPSPELTTDARTGESDVPASPGNAVVHPGPGGVQTLEAPAGGNIDNAYIAQSAAPEPQPGQTNEAPKSALGSSNLLGDGILLAGLLVTAIALAVLVLLYAARQRFYDPLLR